MRNKIIGVALLGILTVGCSGSDPVNYSFFPPAPAPAPTTAPPQLNQGAIVDRFKAGSALLFPNLNISGELTGSSTVIIKVDNYATFDVIGSLPAGVSATGSDANKTLTLTFDNSFNSAQIADFIKANVKVTTLAADVGKKFIATISLTNNGNTVDNGAGATFTIVGISALNLRVDPNGDVTDLDTNTLITGYSDIQGAIGKIIDVSAAADAAGSTITVTAGNYNPTSAIIISNDEDLGYLVVKGPNTDKSGNPTVAAPGTSGNRVTEATINSPGGSNVFDIDNTGITVSGFELKASSNSAELLWLSDAATDAIISNNIFNGSGFSSVMGIHNDSNYPPYHQITGNYFKDLDTGFFYDRATAIATISYNTFYRINYAIDFNDTFDFTSTTPIRIINNVFDAGGLSVQTFYFPYTIDATATGDIQLHNNDFITPINIKTEAANNAAPKIFASSGNYMAALPNDGNFSLSGGGSWPASPIMDALFTPGNPWGFNTSTRNFPTYAP